MAAPHVAGAASLILQGNPSASPDAVWGSLRDSSTTGALSSLGAGSPDRLLFAPTAPMQEPTDPEEPQEPEATVPEAPTGVRAQAGVRSATVTWSLPADGGSPLTGQYVYVYDERGRLRAAVQVAPDATSIGIEKLRPKKPYTFRVSAINLVGQGALSEATSPVSASNR